MNSALIIRTDGTTEELGHKPTYEEARRVVASGRPESDTLVEVAHVMDPDDNDRRKQMLCNEEGLLIGLPVNERATRIYWRYSQKSGRGTPPTPIVGDVILLTGWRFT